MRSLVAKGFFLRSTPHQCEHTGHVSRAATDCVMMSTATTDSLASEEGGGGLVELGSLLPASLGCGHGSPQAVNPDRGAPLVEPTRAHYDIRMHPLGSVSSSLRTSLSGTERVRRCCQSNPSAAAGTELQPWLSPTGSSSGSDFPLPVYSLSCPTWISSSSSSSSSDAGFVVQAGGVLRRLNQNPNLEISSLAVAATCRNPTIHRSLLRTMNRSTGRLHAGFLPVGFLQ